MKDQLDRGSIVEKRVKEYGISNIKLAERTGVTRQTVGDWFRKPDLSFEIILKIGSVIRYDFAQDIPELSIHKTDFLLNEPAADYSNNKVLEIKQELDKWKTEAYSLAKELSALKDKYYKLLLDAQKG